MSCLGKSVGIAALGVLLLASACRFDPSTQASSGAEPGLPADAARAEDGAIITIDADGMANPGSDAQPVTTPDAQIFDDIPCGPETCDENCCIINLGGGQGVPQYFCDTFVCSGNYLKCNDPSDCSFGQVCCLENGDSSCKASCNGEGQDEACDGTAAFCTDPQNTQCKFDDNGPLTVCEDP